MSSHREAPEISKDPVADSTDLYAFRSPDRPSTITLIANYVPLELPPGGPNFYEFGDDVLYEIHIDNDGDADADVTYQFRFTTELINPDIFLYNTGPIDSIDSRTWNRRQFYSVTRVEEGGSQVLATGLACPPCNVGPHSIPSYSPIAAQAVHRLKTGEVVFAGQRAEGFYVDLGSIFDLGDLRPFQNLFAFPPRLPAAAGVNATAGLNVHSIAVQVPIHALARSRWDDWRDSHSVLGIWTSASRQRGSVIGPEESGGWRHGPYVQVSRLGNPLFNEVIVPMGKKDLWNHLRPREDKRFLEYVQHPALADLLPALYPGVFPHLAALNTSKADRADLVAILLTGLPSGVVKGFQNYTGSVYADMLRLNVAIEPSKSPSLLGLLGGDPAGYPNGRRVFDDVATIELRAVAGLTYALVNKSYEPDAAAGAIYDVIDPSKNTPASLSSIGESYLPAFPYLGTPWDGFDNPSTTPSPRLGNP